ncbi:MAG: hypothetical protein IPP51_03400 [Bacteroidetes bacterium]|nr:hypothetical protein [Bacteroidota bacterium]
MELFIKGDTSNLDSVRVQPLLNSSFRTVHISQQWSSSVRGIHVIRAGIDHDKVLNQMN